MSESMNSIDIVNEEIITSWYNKATVRSTPRILVSDCSSEENIYPIARCIICEHPLIVGRGRDTCTYILAQLGYQFLYGVGLLETKFVIRCCLDIIHNHIKDISDFDKLQALTVIIDEAYHAHVALDYVLQLRKKTGVEPLQIPETNRKLDAAARAIASLPEDMRMDFQLLAVTLAENVLTEEIANIGREKEVIKCFSTLMKDHVRDEGRHSEYFVSLMKSHWTKLSDEKKEKFSAMMHEYINDFLGTDTGRTLERKILAECCFREEEIENIIVDTNTRFFAEYNTQTIKTKARLFNLLTKIDSTLFTKESFSVNM